MYFAILDIINNSGWAWTNEGGACIGDHNVGVWEPWVRKHPKAAPFRNAGWVHLEAFKTMVPQAKPRGDNVFRNPVTPPQAALPDVPISQLEDDDYDGHSQPWDLEDKLDGEKEDGEKEDGDESGDEEVEKENKVRNQRVFFNSFVLTYPSPPPKPLRLCPASAQPQRRLPEPSRKPVSLAVLLRSKILPSRPPILTHLCAMHSGRRPRPMWTFRPLRSASKR